MVGDRLHAHALQECSYQHAAGPLQPPTAVLAEVHADR